MTILRTLSTLVLAPALLCAAALPASAQSPPVERAQTVERVPKGELVQRLEAERSRQAAELSREHAEISRHDAEIARHAAELAKEAADTAREWARKEKTIVGAAKAITGNVGLDADMARMDAEMARFNAADGAFGARIAAAAEHGIDAAPTFGVDPLGPKVASAVDHARFAFGSAGMLAGGQQRSTGARTDAMYDEARALIERNRYDRAVEIFNELITQRNDRADAAMYWKAYSLAKLSRGADALATIADLQKQFGSSRWVRDARALEVEIRQAAGQAVSAASENDEELKLLALRGLMQSSPESALPVVEKILSGPNNPRVKERALFLLSQSSSTRAREIILGVAKGGANPDLQVQALRYLGTSGSIQSRQVLDEVYASTTDPAVKRIILRSYMSSGARDRLLAVAKSEQSADLRSEAVQQLGAMNATAELDDLYRVESSAAVKRRILQAMFVAGNVERMSAIARAETDADLRRAAIRNLGLMNKAGAAETLTSIYGSEQSTEVRGAVIEALFLQKNARALVTLARAERNPDLKKEIVSRLSNIRAPEATEYMMELLK